MSGRKWRLWAACLAAAAPTFGQLTLQKVGDGFNQPLALAGAPDAANPNLVYVLELGGRIRTLDTGTGTVGATPFLDLQAALGPGQISFEEDAGVLGMAFAPTFANGTGHVYVSYVGTNAASPLGGESRVDRFTANNGVVDAGSRVNIASFQQPNSVWHKGGWIGFGKDNLLYISTGDGGGGSDPFNLSQNLESAMGKILRVDPSTVAGVGGYAVPASNPFAGSANSITQIVYASGLRNPFRNSFDRLTGDLYIGDVGQDIMEEIDFIAAGTGGQNFGWRPLEGTGDNPLSTDPPPLNAVAPIHEYTHNSTFSGNASVTGGYVVRGGDLHENGQSLDGTYIFGDFVDGTIHSFRYDGTAVTDFRNRSAELNSSMTFGAYQLVSFGEDSQGRLYAIDLGGQVYRFGSIMAVPEPSALALVGAAALAWAARRRRRA